MAQAEKIKVWDLAVRIFHWSLVTLFIISYITGEDLTSIHVWSGYGIVALLAFRVAWGIVGTRYARFTNFVYRPAKIRAYLSSLLSTKPQHYLGHNPAGGLMVIVLLVSLSLTCWTGLEAYAEEGHGPLAQSNISLISRVYADDDGSHDGEKADKDEFWEEVHEFFVNVTLLLVFVHIGGVVVSAMLHRENLVKAMINGYKEEPPGV